ncbi:hypothetical protein QBC34DRAFT_392413 [Podospora aff. communis PSN243]|uniref:BTB domain transcription factor n=1 Tax=Podospora aff. communis PSN243 TaxID=3040156 RepID=A0AAV9H240_9PEZI|nr:hypothetical protein QBC34DRAFT_392413 [Podospora aff. communis PSN243]
MATSTRSKAKNHQKEAESAEPPPAPKAQPGSKHKPEATEAEKSEPEHKRTKKEEDKEETKKEQDEPKGTAVDPHGRSKEDETVPSSILEKGIIYFFIRGRVTVGDEPSSVDEIARSFILLRPIAKDAKLGSGTIGDAGNSRLLAVPKKVFPTSGKERWIAFVEKSGASFAQLREEFLKASEYETKTVGTRTTPAATPVAEGVYAITSTGRESHLVYMLTLPEELGEVQRNLGLKEKGSFVVSTKNPEYPGPRNARLPKAAEYPKEVLEEFRTLRWMGTLPKHLDYVNTQILLVGESSGVKKAREPQKEDKKDGVEEPAEELEKLEEEDLERMKALSDDDTGRVFADLDAHAKEYPKLQTTF